MDADCNRSWGQGDRLGKSDLGYWPLELGLETYDMWVDHFEHAGVQNHVSHLQIGDDNLAEEPGQIGDEAKKPPHQGLIFVTVEKQIMTEMSNKQTADHTQGQVKGIKHT